MPMAEVTVTLPPETVETIVQEVAERVLAELAELDGARASGWLSVASAAVHMDCAEERVRKLVGLRVLPHAAEGPGHRISQRQSEIDAYIESNRQAGREAA